MKNLFIIVIITLFGTPLFSQQKIIVKVKDAETKKDVSYALIQNRSHPQKVVSNEQGEVRITISDSTLLKISAISYEDVFRYVFIAEEVDTINILLKHKTYELNELVVHPYPTRMLFKKAVADLDLPDTNSISANLFMVPNLKGYAEQSKNYQQGDFLTVSLGSPITSIYNLVNKRERSKRKLQKLQWEDDKQTYIHQRFNEEYVRQLLSLKEMKKIKAFMEYCQPTYPFLLTTNDYELACYVLNCYESFLLNQDD